MRVSGFEDQGVRIWTEPDRGRGGGRTGLWASISPNFLYNGAASLFDLDCARRGGEILEMGCADECVRTASWRGLLL